MHITYRDCIDRGSWDMNGNRMGISCENITNNTDEYNLIAPEVDRIRRHP